MPGSVRPIDDLVRQISDLPDDWHAAGSVLHEALRALVRHAEPIRPIRRSVETGTGRTTLLLSHLSDSHTVFAIDDTGISDSHKQVVSSPLLNADSVEFVIGPTQRTVPAHSFSDPIDLAFLDGPHAYPFPDLEYWAVYPHIRQGGLLIVDDIQIPSINNMYRVLAADAMWRQLDVVQNCAFFVRTEAPVIDPYGEGWWLQGFNQTSPSLLDEVRRKLGVRTRLRGLLARRT